MAARPSVTGILVLALCSVPCVVAATSTGIIFNSGKQGSDCSQCHSGGSEPVVRFEGPAQVAIGELATFIFSVESKSGAQTRAGFNVAASGGTLGVLPNQGEQLGSQELTHNTPKRNNSNDIASWMFTWRAPATTGMQTLFGAGNSVNFNGATTGDRSARTTIAIEVVEPSPTPTATQTAPSSLTPTPTVPDPTASPTSSPTATPTNSRRPTPVPTSTPTPTATETATPTVTPVLASQPGNANCDDRLSAADVTAVVPLLGDGVGACALADANCDLAIDARDLDAALGAVFGNLPALCSPQ